MPANKYALLRYRIIDECLTNKGKPYPDLETIRSACEERLYGEVCGRVSGSTVEKDIWAMKNEVDLGYEAPIAHSRKHGGYYYTDPEYTIRELSLSADEQESIRMAATTLFQFRDLGIFDRFGSAIHKIFSRLNMSADMDDDALHNFVQFESTPLAEGTQYLQPLLAAIRDRAEVSFMYTPFNDGAESKRTLQPYLLKEYRNRWYVLGREAKEDRLRTFGLDRMALLVQTEQTFEPDSEFDPQQIFKHSFGITAGGTPELITLWVAKSSAGYIKAQPLHPTQKLLSEDSTGITISIEVIGGYELRSTVLSFGKAMRVLHPDWLAAEVAASK